jgi:excisionase family DNA binding protein
MSNQILLQTMTPAELGVLISDAVKNQIEALKGNTEGNELLTRNQVCELLDIDLSTLHHWRKKGKIVAQGIGSRVYFRRSDVEAALTKIVE